MPIYSYRCEACGAEIEKRQGFHDDPLTTCEACGGHLRRVLHPVGIVFKGSGFYNTDSRKSTSATTPASSGEGESKSSGDGETTKTASESTKPSSDASSSTSSSKSSEPAKSASS